MLRRAATNAYSWWWASHIRTKQSKWLEQSLQDMEEIVAETLKIIDDSGDSFAQRAEMYYRKRPELINFVEEAFRAYRSLAEKYDHLSKELQSANRTIATVFPEQVHYRIDEEEFEDAESGFHETNSSFPNINNQTEKQCNIPKPPSIPKKVFRSPSMLLSRKGTTKKSLNHAKSVSNLKVQCSGLSEVEALAEVDKLQKDILALQTEKEFVRSSYEHSYEKYWEIEDEITGMQKRVYALQDEFSISTVIEDNDARALMATTALNSCKETLNKLKEVQSQSSEEAREAYQKVKEAHSKFESLRGNFISKQTNPQDEETDSKSKDEEEIVLSLEEEEDTLEHDIGMLQERIKEKLEENSGNSLTMNEIAKMIDELVSKVVSLETKVTSQNGLVKRLISEADELQTNIQSLEEDKEVLIEDSENCNKRMKELEEELKKVKTLNQSVKSRDKNLHTHFHEANFSLEHLSGRLKNVKLDEEEENMELHKNTSSSDGKLNEDFEKHVDEFLSDNLEIMNDDVETTNEDKEDRDTNIDEVINEDDDKSGLKENVDFKTEEKQEITQQDKDDLPETTSKVEDEPLDLEPAEEKDQANLNQMLVNGSDDREKIMLEEYTSVLKNYNDVSDKLNNVENKNRNSIFELALQVRELKNVVATKDEEIHILNKKLTSSEPNSDESPRVTLSEEVPLENADQEDNAQGPETLSSDIASTSTENQQQPVENTGHFDVSPIGRTRLIVVREKPTDKPHSLSPLEKKLRLEIDDLLEENLEFWLRFSTSVHQVQQFQKSLQDLKAELRKARHNNFFSEIKNSSKVIQSEIKPIYMHLREIRTELSLWLEHNEVLQDDLQARHPSLCNLQDEIASAANPVTPSKRVELSEYQAAKFQGEVLNVKQESNKVSSELQEGLSYVKGLKIEVEKILEELSQIMGVNNPDHMKQSSSRAKLPLKSFLFGIKLKKQKQSMFACVNPTLQKQYSDLTAANDAPI
ncbi:protein NETWORKED 2A-like [Vicia villosa]|uniref:protein NETWORKED 2A-like n=1 Tax=Vicia villosa TaxID=3911 RepID=UPI00273CE25A|nr:protein NETWORKED 2A-like [Vicia villosa]